MRLWQLALERGDLGLLNDAELSERSCTKLCYKSTFWLTSHNITSDSAIASTSQYFKVQAKKVQNGDQMPFKIPLEGMKHSSKIPLVRISYCLVENCVDLSVWLKIEI